MKLKSYLAFLIIIAMLFSLNLVTFAEESKEYYLVEFTKNIFI